MSMTRRNRMSGKLGKKIESLQKQIADRDASMQRPALQKKLAETQGQLAATNDELGKVKGKLVSATVKIEELDRAVDAKDRTILELQKQQAEVV